MARNRNTPNADTPPNSPAKGEGMVCVAYHDGPGEIGFCGRWWKRGVAQSITIEEWHAIQARADFNEFNFIEETQS